jgi:hypothetical protein
LTYWLQASASLSAGAVRRSIAFQLRRGIVGGMDIQDAIWIAIVGAATGAALNGLVAAGLVALVIHLLSSRREKSGRRDQFRLEAYHDLIDLILKNEMALAARTGAVTIPPADLQAEQIGMIYKLKLFSTPKVQQAYEKYKRVVFNSLAQERQYWPPREDVDTARDELMQAVFDDAG